MRLPLLGIADEVHDLLERALRGGSQDFRGEEAGEIERAAEGFRTGGFADGDGLAGEAALVAFTNAIGDEHVHGHQLPGLDADGHALRELVHFDFLQGTVRHDAQSGLRGIFE